MLGRRNLTFAIVTLRKHLQEACIGAKMKYKGL